MLNGHANQHPLANFPGIKSHPSVRPFLPQSFHTRSRHSGSVAFCNRVRIFNLFCLYYVRVMLMMIVNKILILKLIILGAIAIQHAHSQLFSEPQCHCFFIQLFPYTYNHLIRREYLARGVIIAILGTCIQLYNIIYIIAALSPLTLARNK